MHELHPATTYIDHLYAEHRRLHRAVSAIEALLVRSSAGEEELTMPLFIDGLTDLRGELARHFAEEETGGCLDEAVSRCPSLSGEAALVQGQHGEMLEDVERLLECFRALAPSQKPSAELASDFHRFVRRLLAHEAAENRILQSAFGRIKENGM